MLLRFDPFRELDRMAEAAQAAFGEAEARFPALSMDARRADGKVLIDVDLPGVDRGSIDVTVDKNVLTIEASRRWERGEDEEWFMAERRQGQFRRQLLLGDNLDADHIEAHYTDGVLTITIPVLEKAQPRRIQVSSSEAGHSPHQVTASSTETTEAA